VEKTRLAVSGIDFSGYMVKDADRAIGFYRHVLGLEPARIYPDGHGAEYDFADGSTFGLWGANNPAFSFQPSNGVLLHVDDLDGAAARLRERNISFRDLDLANCRMLGFPDSEGNTVFLHRRKS
jgi:catechol 2,3-dioxygenase-like lactoylglutathione lyase family enzyme